MSNKKSNKKKNHIAEKSDIDIAKITPEKLEELFETRPELIQHVIAQREITHIEHSGPMPYPTVMKEYGDIDSSFPNRMFKMVESQK